jgi:hypothetical protein
MRRPQVVLRCGADRYTAVNERIITFNDGGSRATGMIAFRRAQDGTLMVDVYNTSGPVLVRHEKESKL